MLKIEDFKDFGIREILLSFEQFTREGKDMEINLNFCAEPARDNAWYQINIGECLEDEYKDIEEHRFNSLRKAIKWWNTYFEEEHPADPWDGVKPHAPDGFVAKYCESYTEGK